MTNNKTKFMEYTQHIIEGVVYDKVPVKTFSCSKCDLYRPRPHGGFDINFLTCKHPFGISGCVDLDRAAKEIDDNGFIFKIHGAKL